MSWKVALGTLGLLSVGAGLHPDVRRAVKVWLGIETSNDGGFTPLSDDDLYGADQAGDSGKRSGGPGVPDRNIYTIGLPDAVPMKKTAALIFGAQEPVTFSLQGTDPPGPTLYTPTFIGGDGLSPGDAPKSGVIHDPTGKLNLIGSDQDMEQYAALFVTVASGRYARKKAKQNPKNKKLQEVANQFPVELERTLQNARQTIRWKSPDFGKYWVRRGCKRLEEIGGKTTDGWPPIAPGIFSSSDLKWVFPYASEAQWYAKFEKYHPAEWAYQYAVLWLVDAGVKAQLYSDNESFQAIMDWAGKALVRYGTKIGTAAAGGPWAAVGAAIQQFFEDLFLAVSRAANRPPLVHKTQQNLLEPLEELGKEAGLNFPFVEEGVLAPTGGTDQFPAPLRAFGVNAVHWFILPVFQGAYPMPALGFYRGWKDRKKFAMTDTPADEVSAFDMTRAPQKRL